VLAADGLAWFERLGVVASVVTLLGFLGTFVGLYLAWQQAKAASEAAANAETAAQAAESAVLGAQQAISVNQLRVLVPLLSKLADDLDHSLELDEVQYTKRHLDAWRTQASHVKGLILDDFTQAPAEEIASMLLLSIVLARKASEELLRRAARAGVVEGPELALLDVCDEVRAVIQEVCDRLALWVGEQSLTV
jgi:hypothetical protein